ncbi:MAG: hypothetical protein HKN36_12305 [Hellea sp.]|nr:hypothetical protein [Hellea sp.]
MRIKILGIMAVLALGAASASAGTGYSQSYEGGVVVHRGEHGSALSQQAIAIHQEKARQEAAMRQARKAARLNRQLAEQSATIDALTVSVNNIQKAQTRKKRRRTYYGNPPFFGSNGFIGNRYHGGGTIILRKRRRH